MDWKMYVRWIIVFYFVCVSVSVSKAQDLNATTSSDPNLQSTTNPSSAIINSPSSSTVLRPVIFNVSLASTSFGFSYGIQSNTVDDSEDSGFFTFSTANESGTTKNLFTSTFLNNKSLSMIPAANGTPALTTTNFINVSTTMSNIKEGLTGSGSASTSPNMRSTLTTPNIGASTTFVTGINSTPTTSDTTKSSVSITPDTKSSAPAATLEGDSTPTVPVGLGCMFRPEGKIIIY